MRRAVTITIAAGVVRLIIAALTPLYPDEMYYWEWSRRLAAGYFDHPPMIAWLIRAGTLIAGDTSFGVRLFSVLAGIVAGLFLCAAARRLAGDRAALITAIVFAVIPLSAAGLILATPDAAALAAGAAMCYAVIRALEHTAGSAASLRWWCAGGVALGVAAVSKYTAVLLPLGVFVALLARRDLRPRLREPGPYVATAISLLVFSPVILWNATHDWMSFAFQLRHGFGPAGGSVIARQLELLGGQLLLVSPILFAMMLLATTRPTQLPPAASPLFPIFALVFGFFVYSATKRRVEANWPALAYVPAILLLAAREPTRLWDRWLRGGIALAATCTAIIYVNAFAPILPVPAARDPVARSAGWDELAGAVERIQVRHRGPSGITLIATDRYQDASALAFHLPDHPETYAVNLTTRPNQYDLWPGFADRAQPGDALILVADDVAGDEPTVVVLAPRFSRITRGEQVVLARDGDPVKAMRVWLLEGWLGTWPKPAVRSRT